MPEDSRILGSSASRRPGWTTAVACSAMTGATVIGGCGGPLTQTEQVLLTLDATQASQPVMLSHVPSAKRGHQVSVASGSFWEVTTVDETDERRLLLVRRGESNLPASEQLVNRVGPDAKWVQLELVSYDALDADRQRHRVLVIEGRVQP